MHRYILACLLAVGIVSCAGDEYEQEPIPSKDRVTVNLTFSTGRSTNDEVEADDPEDQLRSLRVYIFSDGELVGYQPETTIPARTTSQVLEMQLSLSNSAIPSEGYPCTFYIIANEDAAVGLKLGENTNYTLPTPVQTDKGFWTLPEETTEETFKDIKFIQLPTATEEWNKDGKTHYGSILPMAAIHKETIHKDTKSIEIGLQRSVAKLSLYFAKTGSGELYMDRGMYLYNVPQEGYLFPRQNLEESNIDIGNKETGLDREETSDSDDHQRSGQELLEPDYEPDTTTPAHKNEITTYYPIEGEPDGIPNPKNYQQMPDKPIYLFAHYTGVDKADGIGDPKTDKGYYVKLLFHMHEDKGDNGEIETNHDGKINRVFLPKVDANEEVRIFSRIYMEGYIKLELHWMVEKWEDGGGGDITFN